MSLNESLMTFCHLLTPENGDRLAKLAKVRKFGRSKRGEGDLTFPKVDDQIWQSLRIDPHDLLQPLDRLNGSLGRQFQLEHCSIWNSRPVFQLRKENLTEVAVKQCLDIRSRSQPLDGPRIFNAELERKGKSNQLSMVRCEGAVAILRHFSQFFERGKAIKVSCADDSDCQLGPVLDAQSGSKDVDSSLLDHYEKLFVLYKDLAVERRPSGLSDQAFVTHIHRSVCADLQFQLFQTSWSRPCHLNSSATTESSSFVLYNYARIVNIFRAFEEELNLTLPNVSTVDWKLIKEPEEWDLVLCFIARYQDVIGEAASKMQFHSLFIYMIDLTSLFSRYYKRVRILKNFKHLQNEMFARIYLLKAIKAIYDQLFQLLNIQPNLNM